MSFVRGLQCRECGQEYPKEPLHVCETCFGPLEIVYDYDAIKKSISREKSRPVTKICGAIANYFPSMENRRRVSIRVLPRSSVPRGSAKHWASKSSTSKTIQ